MCYTFGMNATTQPVKYAVLIAGKLGQWHEDLDEFVAEWDEASRNYGPAMVTMRIHDGESITMGNVNQMQPVWDALRRYREQQVKADKARRDHDSGPR